jgi:hypothetical protein
LIAANPALSRALTRRTRQRFGIDDGVELTVPGGVPKLKSFCTAATMIFGLRENRSRTLGAVDRFN